MRDSMTGGTKDQNTKKTDPYLESVFFSIINNVLIRSHR